MMKISLWWAFLHIWHQDFQSVMKSPLFSSFQLPLSTLWGNKKVLASKTLSKAICPWTSLFISFSILSNTTSARLPGLCPWNEKHVGKCFSICKHCVGMRDQMTGFHLDIIYLLYQYFILKKVHQCENWRENIFWLRNNLEIIKVKAYGSKGGSFMLLE